MPLVEVQVPTPTTNQHERADSVITIRTKEKDRHSQRDHVPPHEDFYGRHRWDPNETWSAQEEAAVVRKTDLMLIVIFGLILLGIHVDRSNIFNALTDNFLHDAGLDTRHFDNGIMIARIAVLVSEFPVQFMVLRFGFRKVFPPLIMTWGVISACQCLIHGGPAFYVLRALIGLLEAGYIPGMVHFLTQFYTTSEMAPRLAILAAMHDLAHIVAALFAAAVLHMRGVAGKPGWFWLFLIEGCLTFCIGVFSLLYLPWCPTQTKSFICRKPWYNEREESILVNRLLRDDPGKGQEALTLQPTVKEVLDTWTDKKLWMLYACSFLGIISYLPVRQFLSLTLRRLHFTVFQSNMLQVPPAVIHMIGVLLLAWNSERMKERTWHCAIAHFFPVPFLVALETLPGTLGMWERYGLTASIVASPTYVAILLAWICEASFSVRKRAIAVTTVNVFFLAGAIAAAQVYQKSDEPYYYDGNKFLITVATFTCLLFILNKQCMVRVNKKRDQKWNDMTIREQIDYQLDTEHENFHGNQRIDFRFPT